MHEDGRDNVIDLTEAFAREQKANREKREEEERKPISLSSDVEKTHSIIASQKFRAMEALDILKERRQFVVIREIYDESFRILMENGELE